MWFRMVKKIELLNHFIDLGVTMQREIFDKGCNAFMAGRSRDTNPYDKTNQYAQWYEWDTGWELSEEEANIWLNNRICRRTD